MKLASPPFDFGISAPVAPEAGLTVKIPRGLSDKSALLATIATQANFPDYFGKNFDALLDMLRDLSWQRQKDLILLHEDCPPLTNRAEQTAYLLTLRDAVSAWADNPDHCVIVRFPLACRALVLEALNSQA